MQHPGPTHRHFDGTGDVAAVRRRAAPADAELELVAGDQLRLAVVEERLTAQRLEPVDKVTKGNGKQYNERLACMAKDLQLLAQTLPHNKECRHAGRHAARAAHPVATTRGAAVSCASVKSSASRFLDQAVQSFSCQCPAVKITVDGFDIVVAAECRRSSTRRPLEEAAGWARGSGRPARVLPQLLLTCVDVGAVGAVLHNPARVGLVKLGHGCWLSNWQRL